MLLSHVTFSGLLQRCFENKLCFGSLFSDACQFLREYVPYVTNFDSAMSTLTSALRNESFRKYINRGLKGEYLQSYLILPIQRIPRYLKRGGRKGEIESYMGGRGRVLMLYEVFFSLFIF